MGDDQLSSIDAVREVKKLRAGLEGSRLRAECLETQLSEARARAAELGVGLSLVSGALCDTGTAIVGHTGKEYAEAIRELTKERDAARARLEEVERERDDEHESLNEATRSVLELQERLATAERLLAKEKKAARALAAKLVDHGLLADALAEAADYFSAAVNSEDGAGTVKHGMALDAVLRAYRASSPSDPGRDAGAGPAKPGRRCARHPEAEVSWCDEDSTYRCGACGRVADLLDAASAPVASGQGADSKQDSARAVSPSDFREAGHAAERLARDLERALGVAGNGLASGLTNAYGLGWPKFDASGNEVLAFFESIAAKPGAWDLGYEAWLAWRTINTQLGKLARGITPSPRGGEDPEPCEACQEEEESTRTPTVEHACGREKRLSDGDMYKEIQRSERAASPSAPGSAPPKDDYLDRLAAYHRDRHARELDKIRSDARTAALKEARKAVTDAMAQLEHFEPAGWVLKAEALEDVLEHLAALASPTAPGAAPGRPTVLPDLESLIDWMREERKIRAEINAGEEGHTYENGWCDALDNVAERLGCVVVPVPASPGAPEAK